MNEPTPERAAFVQARFDALDADGIRARLDRINREHLPAVMAGLKLLQGTPLTVATRGLWFAIEPLTREVGKLAACRKGCSHCCHGAVAVNQVEAELIGRATGIEPATPANRKLEGRQRFADAVPFGYEHPCPFLVNDECSIYETRPLACRTQFNMDVDAELCRLDQGVNKVPYYNTGNLDQLGVMAAGGPHRITLADIREFFPNVKEGKPCQTR